ncbi:MAG: glycosyltransferase family 39 protein [Gemmataceae bacterium]|nr:glycosyltransferase family 39 protein [Gemmataceae bacterium]
MNDCRATLLPASRSTAPILGRFTHIQADEAAAPDPSRKYVVLLFWTFLALGVVSRVAHYLPQRAFWHDEAALAVNITERSFGQLLEPLDYNQGAPPGFLMLERVVYLRLGGSEHALRLVPFLCCIASLFVFPRVARQFVSPNAALIALGLFALTRPLTYYGGELKQYSSDVLITLLLLGYAARIHGQLRRDEPAGTWLWGILGAVALWFSHCSIFVLAGSGVAYALACLRRRDGARLAGFATAMSVWLLSFAVCYFLSFQKLSHSDYMQTFWKDHFMPLLPHSAGQLEWFPRTFFGTLESPVGFAAQGMSLAGIAALALLTGGTWLFQTRPFALAALLLPTLFALLASGLHKYPFGNRLILFLVPGILIVVAAGAERIRAWSWPEARPLGIAFLSLLFFAPVVGTAGRFVQHSGADEITPLLAHLSEQRQEGDCVYVYVSGWPAYRYYASQYGLPLDGPVTHGSLGEWDHYLRELDQFRGQERVWVVLVHHQRVDRLLRCHLDRMGTKQDALVVSSGAAIYRYDLKRESPSAERVARAR